MSIAQPNPLERMLLGSPRSRPESRPLPDSPKTILVVSRLGLGMLVLSTPTLAALRAAAPEAEIHLLTAPSLEALYHDTPLLSRVTPLCMQGIGAIRASLGEVRRMAPCDLLINLDGLDERSRKIAMAHPAECRIGFIPPDQTESPYDLSLPLSTEGHVTESLAHLIKLARVSTSSTTLIPPSITSAEDARAAEFMRELGFHDEDLVIGINMNAGDFAHRRRWPAEKFVLLAQAIEDMGEYRTLFLGTAAEERYIYRHIKSMDAETVQLAGQTSARQLAALLKRLHLLVANDSGPVHLAAALGTPTLSLYGPASPARYGPPPSTRNAVMYADPPCSPCLSILSGTVAPCPHGRRCMFDLSVQRVQGVLLDLLQHLSDPPSPPWTIAEKNADSPENT